MMTKIRTTLITLLLVLVSSCYQDNFLKDELLAQNSVDFLYSSPEGIGNAVVGLYSLNREPYQKDFFNGAMPLILQAKSDISLGIDGEISLFSNCFWGCGLPGDYGTEAVFGSFWSHNYRMIDITNNIIAGGERLIATGNTDASLLKSIAEAKTFRSHAYFTLFRMFKNIYIKAEPTNPENAFDRPTAISSQEDILALIRSDLSYASENLTYASTEFGRWNKGAVDHIRAKVEMWAGEYAAAAEIVDEIIDEGGYSLVPSNKVFDGELNHSETLFAVNFEKATIGGGEWQQINWQTVAAYANEDGLKQSVENGSDGAGFLTLNPYAINLINENPDDLRKDNYYVFEYLYNDPETLPSGKSIGDPLDKYTDTAAGDTFFNYYKRQGPGVIKFQDKLVDATDRMHFKNIMVYRLAETYLIGAEAHLEAGDAAKASQYLNAVRERAGIPAISAATIENIFEERARELAFEGQRWYSLKRKGLLYDYLIDHMNSPLFNEYYGRNHVNPIDELRPHMVNLPIPKGVLDLLGAGYPQNEGYN
jgi:starch-binding outer membrane protein, SusD/RagB family